MTSGIPMGPFVPNPRVQELVRVLLYLGGRGLIEDAKTFDAYVPGLRAELTNTTVTVGPEAVTAAEATIRRAGFEPVRLTKDTTIELLDKLKEPPS